MFWFWGSSLSEKIDRLREAESNLLRYVSSYGNVPNPEDYELNVFDTDIPKESIPLKSRQCQVFKEDSSSFRVHGVRVRSSKTENDELESSKQTPLVLLHGYMNGSAYFYRNLIGLSSVFQTVYSLDMLGWGLSSRPRFQKLTDTSVSTTEEFFVNSLEEWRKANGLERMILAGHSMGGYMSVAYAERYPERVERLILASPVGVPHETEDMIQQRQSRFVQSSWKRRLFLNVWKFCFRYSTPGEIVRLLPTGRGLALVQEYVKRRIPAIEQQEERQAVTDYLYQCATALPGSGEYCINKILNPTVLAKEALVHRIPKLQVPHVTFLYGKNDWMESTGGLDVQETCTEMGGPQVDVYEVSNAGHLLMLENWKEFNAGMVLAGGKAPSLVLGEDAAIILMPKKLFPAEAASMSTEVVDLEADT